MKDERQTFEELLTIRQSVRKYQDKPIERKILLKLAQAVRLAPSASNSQPWKLIFVTEPELKHKVAEATYSSLVSFNKFVPQAPVLAVLTIERPKLVTQVGGMVKRREFPLIDIGIAAEHLCLRAAELGLGSCMLGWFDEPRIQQLLHIPRKTRVGLVVSLGYAPEGYPVRKKIRKSLDEMCGFDRYF